MAVNWKLNDTYIFSKQKYVHIEYSFILSVHIKQIVWNVVFSDAH